MWLKRLKIFLHNQIKLTELAGIKKILIDPGIGFGKRLVDNFNIIKQLKDFEEFGYPIMVGVSRKSFIGKTLDLDIENRDIATVIMETVAVMKSARIIRTHNVKYCMHLVKLASHIL